MARSIAGRTGLADELLAAGLAPGTVSNVLIRSRPSTGALLTATTWPTTRPLGSICRPRHGRGRSGSRRRAEAARLLAALPEPDRPLWATAFYAGLRGANCKPSADEDVDLGRALIRVERGWTRRKGRSSPSRGRAGATVPLLAILRDHLDEHLHRTGRRGRAGVRPRRPLPFAPINDRQRAKEAWRSWSSTRSPSTSAATPSPPC